MGFIPKAFRLFFSWNFEGFEPTIDDLAFGQKTMLIARHFAIDHVAGEADALAAKEAEGFRKISFRGLGEELAERFEERGGHDRLFFLLGQTDPREN